MNVQVEVTTRCNFDCFYCAGRDMEQQDMPFEQYLSIVDSHVARYGLPAQISLQGEGEPTLNKSFFQMAAYARGIGAEPFTITNGTYKYPEHFAESFASIGISIDTLDVSEAEKIGRHNLPRVLEFIDAAEQSLKIIIFSVALSPALGEVAAWCRRRGFAHVVQPLQGKTDYRYRYPRFAIIPHFAKKYKCTYLENDLMRYYAINGKELPCSYIKDTRKYISIDALRDQFANRQVPGTCAGCRYLT